jgi:long-chain acyl-CoA synthetase
MQLSRADVIGHSTARTIPGLFRERVARSPDAIAYREWDDAIRRWQDYSWRDMAGLVRRYEAALPVAPRSP